MSSTFASGWIRKPALERLEQVASHSYSKPIKKIHDGPDVSFFLSSFAYRDIMTFVLQLNHAMIPRKTQIGGQNTTQAWPLGSKHVQFSESVLKIRSLLGELDSLVLEAPPDTGPRRFGNVSFRKWYSLVEERATQLMGQYLSCERLPALEELESYLLGGFGSPQRLDYGTGHELSFLAFLGCLWKLGFFDTSEAGAEERSIVLGIFEDYLNLIRKLIKTYTLEPAGSHGVWGLDDNSFLPYVFGSAQLCPPIADADETPVEGSLPRSPEPSSVIRQDVVSRQRKENMYFSAIGFISDVKSGPFWEHSPMLFDISGIRDGWGKVNKGMIKMYSAEVLGKFPVVQHFPFGSLFRWEKDPEAKLPPPTSHDVSQPLRAPLDSHAPSAARAGPAPAMGGGTAAPWARLPAQPVGIVGGVTKTPWASRTPPPPPPPNGVSMQNRPVPRGPGSGAVSDRFQSSKSATVRTDAGTQEEGEHK